MGGNHSKSLRGRCASECGEGLEKTEISERWNGFPLMINHFILLTLCQCLEIGRLYDPNPKDMALANVACPSHP